jgi:DNA-binding NarL/FixJ family response regulator
MRLVVADDAAVIRTGFARLLAAEGFDVAAEVGDADELLECVAHEQPDVAIIDIRMPPTFTDEGLRAAEVIRATHPQVGVLVLSQHVEFEYALRLIDERAERVGYLLKDRLVDLDAFTAALRRIAEGGSVVDPQLVAELVDVNDRSDPLSELTAREREVLALMAEGLTDRGIAERGFITRKTVETHVRSILRKLDLPATPNENRRVHAVLRFLNASAGGGTSRNVGVAPQSAKPLSER